MHTLKQVTNNVSKPEDLGFIPAPLNGGSQNISEPRPSPVKGHDRTIVRIKKEIAWESILKINVSIITITYCDLQK